MTESEREAHRQTAAELRDVQDIIAGMSWMSNDRIQRYTAQLAEPETIAGEHDELRLWIAQDRKTLAELAEQSATVQRQYEALMALISAPPGGTA